MIKKATNVQYSYIISGNGIQNGNPSPSNILPFDGCGDRTENLYPLDINKLHVGRIENDGTIDYEVGTLVVGTDSVTYEASTIWRGFYTDFIQVNEDEKLTFSPNNSSTIAWSCNCYDENDNFLGKATPQSTASTRTFTLLTGTKKVRMNVTSSSTSYTITEPMLNVGSTALPYKPYGYTLPIEYGGSENLFDSTIYELVPASTTAQRKGINLGVLPQGSYTLNAVTSSPTQIYRTTKNGDTYTYETILTLPYTFTTDGISEQIIRTAGQSGNSWADIGYTNIMLNRGGIPLPYKPYIEPINTNIYLGEVESTRKIKKLVLTGEETLTSGSVIGQIRTPLTEAINSLGYCTHYILKTSYGGAFPYIRIAGNVLWFELSPDGYETKEEALADFKSYLAAQYAAGTPVCVWYVLTIAEVSITNEPLMKIGSYVDTINNTQSGIPISTNNLTVNTTIPPSKIDITSTATWVPINYNKYNTETISTIAPIDFLSNRQNITVGVKGNTEQLEIPSPDNPIMPQGTGDRTWNLLNLNRTYSGTFTTDTTKWMNGAATVTNVGTAYAETEILGDTIKVTSKISGYGASFLIEASPNTAYTVSFEADKESSGSWGGISDRDINGTVISNSAMYGKSVTFTTHDNCAFLNVCFRFPPADGTVTFSKIMLNMGSTPLPYEPYGYKLDILSSGENLFDEIYTDLVQGQTVKYKPVYVGDGNFTLSTDYPLVQAGTADLFLLPGNVSSGASTVLNGCYQVFVTVFIGVDANGRALLETEYITDKLELLVMLHGRADINGCYAGTGAPQFLDNYIIEVLRFGSLYSVCQ